MPFLWYHLQIVFLYSVFDFENHIIMKRRTAISNLLKRKKIQKTKNYLPPDSDLTPYTGEWGYEEAAHLLRRTMFGPTYAQIKEAATDGLDVTISRLMTVNPLPNPPINYYFESDPNVPIGETWIEATYSQTENYFQYRRRSLGGWIYKQLFDEGVNIREKMVLFWHNHFVTADVNDPKFNYNYLNRIREFALGNFREFTKAITIDPSMLRYLNGNQNKKNAPNENYARELLELFTIGKGELIPPNDYTNYTEDDIKEIAKVLTGWRDRGFRSTNGIPIESVFRHNRHDTGDKQLSHRFDNMVISNLEASEYAHLIDIIFGKIEVARFISRKLYRWFVYYEIDDTIETNIINPLAQIIFDNDFEIVPGLEVLLKSQHFYDVVNTGGLIKSPIDFIMSVVKTFELELPETVSGQYIAMLRLFQTGNLFQMNYMDIPSVAGWKAYYQQPSFNELWINSVTLPYRMNFTNVLTGNGIFIEGSRYRVDLLAFLQKLDNPSDANAVVAESIKILFPRDVSQNRKDYLKNILLSELPDYEWTVEYSNYVAEPDNEELAGAIRTRVKNLISIMLSMPEFYLS